MKKKQNHNHSSHITSTNDTEDSPPLTTEEIIALTDFIATLRGLVDDVLDQGYTINADGNLIPPQKASQAKSNL